MSVPATEQGITLSSAIIGEVRQAVGRTDQILSFSGVEELTKSEGMVTGELLNKSQKIKKTILESLGIITKKPNFTLEKPLSYPYRLITICSR